VRRLPLRAVLAIAALAASGCGDPSSAATGPMPDGHGAAIALGVQYRRLRSPQIAAMAVRCDTALVLARAFDDWITAVRSAGVEQGYLDEVIDARIRAAVIRKRCASEAGGRRHGALAAERERRR